VVRSGHDSAVTEALGGDFDLLRISRYEHFGAKSIKRCEVLADFGNERHPAKVPKWFFWQASGMKPGRNDNKPIVQNSNSFCKRGISGTIFRYFLANGKDSQREVCCFQQEAAAERRFALARRIAPGNGKMSNFSP
jgi:hypothetical protein